MGVSAIPLVSGRSLKTYSLAIVYQAPSAPEERIPSAYVHFVRFANFGREPIRREDIAPGNRLRIEVQGARVLDFRVDAVRRSVSNINIEPGAIVRILTTARTSDVALVGDIIGQPAGIRSSQEVRKRRGPTWVGVVLSFATFATALALTPVIYYWVTGSWANVWLLVLPFVAVLLPIAVIILVNVTLWPKSELEFPRELLPRFHGIPPAIHMQHGFFQAGPMEYGSFEFPGDDEHPDDQPEGKAQHGSG